MPLRIIPALNRQTTYSNWDLWWGDPPTGLVKVELWGQAHRARRSAVPAGGREALGWEPRRWEINQAGIADGHFLNEQRGFAVQGHLWTTGDGARTWTPIYPNSAP